mgnify:CR=1 FL=1
MEIGFNKNEVKTLKNLVINHDFTNAIMFGRTGSGKTSCESSFCEFKVRRRIWYI